jgi:hypothetical protein
MAPENEDEEGFRLKSLLDHPVISNLMALYNAAQSKIEKRRVLSLVATAYPYSTTMKLFQCSAKAVYKARVHARSYGVGAEPVVTKHSRNRIGEKELYLIIFFEHEDAIYHSPCTQHGVEIAGYLNDTPRALFGSYKTFCQQRGQTAASLSYFKKYIKQMGYKKRSVKTCLCNQCSKYGFDNFSDFELLVNDILEEVGSNVVIQRGLLKCLSEVRGYYWTDFKKELSLESKVPALCLRHCLSDPDPTSDFASPCDHEHDDFPSRG